MDQPPNVARLNVIALCGRALYWCASLLVPFYVVKRSFGRAGTRFSRARCRRWELWELLWRTYPSYVESCARNVVACGRCVL